MSVVRAKGYLKRSKPKSCKKEHGEENHFESDPLKRADTRRYASPLGVVGWDVALSKSGWESVQSGEFEPPWLLFGERRSP